MKHARSDYEGRIVDLNEQIPEAEPCFLLRGQDKATPAAIEAWAQMAAHLGADRDMIDRARLYAREVREYQAAIGGGKVPDLPADDDTGDEAGHGAGSGAGKDQGNPPKTREDGYPADWNDMDVARHKNAGLFPPGWDKARLDKWFEEQSVS